MVRIPLRQWMLRITAYADRLDRELDDLAWPESIKKLQRDWIGRSTGAEVDFFIGEAAAGEPTEDAFSVWKQSRQDSGFPTKPNEDVLRVYTTRPDTLYGVTAMVIAPEHPVVDRLTTTAQRKEVEAYPFAPLDATLAEVAALPFAAGVRERVMGGNAAALLGC